MTPQSTASLKETPVAGISGDRRSQRRYPLNLPVQYKIMKHCMVVGVGTGHSIDLSSSGIQFATEHPLQVGSYLELSVSWPVLLNQSCPLKLVASGRVVRSGFGSAAIRMDRHEFHTQAARRPQPVEARKSMAMGSR